MTRHHSRRTPRTRHAALAGAAAALLLGVAGTAVAAEGTSGAGVAATGTNSTAVAAEEPGGAGVQPRGGIELREVEPYEPVEITEDAWMGLLPEGEQNYVVSPPAAFEENIEAAQGYPGTRLRPDSISSGHAVRDGRVEYVHGAWRFAEPPARVEVRLPGGRHAAELVTLPGRPGWGAYHLDVAALDAPGDEEFTVTAYGPDGEVLDATTVTPWP